MKVLELFAGARCVGRNAEKLGYEVFSVDWENYDGIDLSIDIGILTPEHIPFIPDIIWASPDCATYSIAGIRFHRKSPTNPTSEYAKKCDIVNQHFIKLIQHYLEINPNLKFFIENPRGCLRKMPWMRQFDRGTVTYCQYGDKRMKPTDIWTNHLYTMYNLDGWKPRPICRNNDKCHDPSPRGSKGGTQSLKNAHERSKIPDELCIEILKSVKLC